MLDPHLGAALLARAIERHGGLDRWRRVRAIELELRSLSGAIPRGKGLGRSFSAPARMRVEPGRSRVLWPDWPRPGSCGIYEDGRVAILPQPSPPTLPTVRLDAVPAAISPRSSFAGLRRWRRWRDTDALYFFGYALVHYLSLPFSLREAELVSARRLAGGGGELWYRLPQVHTHSSLEGFRFDSSGLLVRHDYRADVISRMACGAHLSSDYVELQGLPVARERAVFAKLGHRPSAPVTPLVVLRASLRPLAVELGEA